MASATSLEAASPAGAAVHPFAPRAVPALSREAQNARPDPRRFAFLAVQLLLLLWVIHIFRIESDKFLRLFICVLIAFAVHYVTPLRLKKAAFIGLSLLTACAVLKEWDNRVFASPAAYVGPLVFLTAAFMTATAFYVAFRLPVPFWVQSLLALGVGAGLTWGAAVNWPLADYHWKLIGAIFMFRTIVYAYDAGGGTKRESLGDFYSYFFLPPNFYFHLFPVVDYTTFKKSWYADDAHRTAQRGIVMMLRGVVQLLLYRVIMHRWQIGPDDVRSFATLCQWLFVPYLLYVQVSGQFHVIVGMLHLFGYKLPETNRRYFLAGSFTDYWRRINIYWKDFMIKVFYYPAYFRLRKRNETLALTVATAWVFLATTLLHAWQFFWLSHQFRMDPKDVLFWTTLGVLVWITVLRETRRGPSRARPASLPVRAASCAGVFLTISLLWSVWTSYSLAEWWDTVTYWS